jgi:transposase
MNSDLKEDGIRRKYDEQFKLNAVKMVENGQSARSVAQSLGINEGLLHKWKSARNRNRTELEAENAKLKAQLRQVETERDILKKALSIFSRQN